MTAASLPSTLVKCLYLLFDLPEYESPSPDVTTLQTDKESTEFSPSERRILLQKVFVQVSACCYVLVVHYTLALFLVQPILLSYITTPPIMPKSKKLNPTPFS